MKFAILSMLIFPALGLGKPDISKIQACLAKHEPSCVLESKPWRDIACLVGKLNADAACKEAHALADRFKGEFQNSYIAGLHSVGPVAVVKLGFLVNGSPLLYALLDSTGKAIDIATLPDKPSLARCADCQITNLILGEGPAQYGASSDGYELIFKQFVQDPKQGFAERVATADVIYRFSKDGVYKGYRIGAIAK